jgi:hypothetical protein
MSEEYPDYPQGGEEEFEGDGPNLRYDDFVERIVQDPNKPPGVTLLSGYLGSSSEEGHVRLYLDEELSRYVEIPEKAVRHAQRLPPEQSPLGGSLVWIDRDVEVLHGAAGSERRKATFLEGQIAQDFIGAAADPFHGLSGSTQARECLGPPTRFGPGCGQSQAGPCIPQTEILNCHTLTGILCTRLGPSCRRTLFEPACTAFGPNCRTVVFNQCGPSVFSPCFTQGGPDCQASGFVCDPLDFTIWQGQLGQQQQFGQQGAANVAARPVGPNVSQAWVCPTGPILCQSRSCPTMVRCPTVDIRCSFERVSRGFRCETFGACPSAVDACPSRFGCESQAGCFNTQVCGVSQGCFPGGGRFDPAGGGGGAQAFEAQFQTPATQTKSCQPQTALCPVPTSMCPTNFNCPSQFVPCQSQLVRCPSALDACPTRFNCPTLPNGCPGDTRFGSCETHGACPSAVDACPTRFGCFPGGGFNPGGF